MTTPQPSGLSDFVRNAAPEEKERVYRIVLDGVTARQNEVLAKAGEDTLRMSTLLHAMGSMGEPVEPDLVHPAAPAVERCPCGYPMPCVQRVPITFCKAVKAPRSVHPAAPCAVVSAPRLSLCALDRTALPLTPIQHTEAGAVSPALLKGKK